MKTFDHHEYLIKSIILIIVSVALSFCFCLTTNANESNTIQESTEDVTSTNIEDEEMPLSSNMVPAINIASIIAIVFGVNVLILFIVYIFLRKRITVIEEQIHDPDLEL
ncbi:MAG: hypothetical protein PHQ65_17445 [Bacteroidales bacterium]|nr:hypothetical protein [Bacteroidales bacterium]